MATKALSGRIVRVGIVGAVAAALVVAVAGGHLGQAAPALAAGRVVHHVSAGGPDNINWWCYAEDGQVHPGCDGNFSLSVNAYADGTVSGEYTDQFAQGDGGIHAVLNCLVVEGNTAWVSGVVTSGGTPDWATGEWVDWTGWEIGTVVRDNGTSSGDPADQVSFTWYQGPLSPPPPSGSSWAPHCTEKPAWYLDFLTNMPKGQVTIRETVGTKHPSHASSEQGGGPRAPPLHALTGEPGPGASGR